jgi:ABC-2 type transport system permease protein
MMHKLLSALRVEYLKTRKSKIVMITIIFFAFIPMMMALMMFIAGNPEIASKLGLIGTKSRLLGTNDWIGYMALLSQSLAAVGLIGSGFVTSWVFGREHLDRTLKDLLALPVNRSYIVLAKYIIIFQWCMLLFLILYVVGATLGFFMNIPGWSASLFLNFTRGFILTALLTLLLTSPVAWLAGYSRGIIAPLGFVILTMILAQFVGLIGLGPYFPWAIPGLYSVANNAPGFQLHPASYILLTLTFLIGYWGTLRWWQHADHP